MGYVLQPTNFGPRWFGYTLLSIVVGVLSACSEFQPKAPSTKLDFIASDYKDLHGWLDDNHKEALLALLHSCAPLEAKGLTRFGNQQFWRRACTAARAKVQGTTDDARRYFENYFIPHAIVGGGKTDGLITGYFEPELQGSRIRRDDYIIPLYLRPSDLVSANLGLFSTDLKGKHVSGRVIKGTLIPYHDRAMIEDGALSGRKLELVWVNSLTDAFFLHIQGSGRIRLRNGKIIRVGYSATNGRPYTAIGRELIITGAIPRATISMQTIQKWLDEHPEKGIQLMRTNKSYVFFRELKHKGPIGAQGVPLTPERSLAVDRRLLPLGLPVWLATTLPTGKTYRRLMIAQDTGGAIRGAVRADVFWGSGDRARNIAGRMKSTGRYWYLVPRTDRY